MNVDIDCKNKDFQIMNILQLKWILLNLISKKNYKKELRIIKMLIIKVFIFLFLNQIIQYPFLLQYIHKLNNFIFLININNHNIKLLIYNFCL